MRYIYICISYGSVVYVTTSKERAMWLTKEREYDSIEMWSNTKFHGKIYEREEADSKP